MSAQTPIYGIPYPEPGDPLGAIQEDLQGIAEGVESSLLGFGGVPAPGSWLAVGAAGQPAFVSGWGAFGAPHQAPQFRKVGTVVTLRGLVLRSGAPTSGAWGIFTLPPGYRPLAELVFSTLAGDLLMRLDVEANGVVSTRFDVPTSRYVSLSGISFHID